IFLTETARLASVVLPSAAFAEKDGTMTNLERRVQRLNAAVPLKAEAKQDWEIITAVATALGADWGFTSAGEVFGEIAASVAGYEGLSFDGLGDAGTLCGQPAAAVAAEPSNGHDRKLWYTPLERETEPQATGA
ncbi:MAG TPA: molybdopterin-dependent oxidoreductase, partial [Chloroflexota bacterium]